VPAGTTTTTTGTISYWYDFGIPSNNNVICTLAVFYGDSGTPIESHRLTYSEGHTGWVQSVIDGVTLGADKTLELRFTCNEDPGAGDGYSFLELDDLFVGIPASA
jgi:hypothetical protein